MVNACNKNFRDDKYFCKCVYWNLVFLHRVFSTSDKMELGIMALGILVLGILS